MKKLYRKGTVHPSPSSSPPISDLLSLSYLPAAILTLAAALTAEDKEVLTYLLSCSSVSAASKSHRKKTQLLLHHHHPPCFTCYCFNCYTSYWARWDSSPNRQLIHEIIDAFEDGLAHRSKKQGITRREKRNNNNNNKRLDLNLNLNDISNGNNNNNNNGSDGLVRVNPELGRTESVDEGCVDEETGEKQGSVRKLVSFIGETIWGSVWG